MKRIGPVAAKLVRNPIELVAAANQKRSTELGTGQSGEEMPTSPSKASTAGGQTGGDAVMEAGKDGDPRQPVARDVRQTIEPFGAASIACPSVMLRNMRVTSPNGLPRPVARIFLVTIDGVCVHLPPAQAAKSGSARATKNKMAQMTQSF